MTNRLSTWNVVLAISAMAFGVSLFARGHIFSGPTSRASVDSRPSFETRRSDWSIDATYTDASAKRFAELESLGRESLEELSEDLRSTWIALMEGERERRMIVGDYVVHDVLDCSPGSAEATRELVRLRNAAAALEGTRSPQRHSSEGHPFVEYIGVGGAGSTEIRVLFYPRSQYSDLWDLYTEYRAAESIAHSRRPSRNHSSETK